MFCDPVINRLPLAASSYEAVLLEQSEVLRDVLQSTADLGCNLIDGQLPIRELPEDEQPAAMPNNSA